MSAKTAGEGKSGNDLISASSVKERQRKNAGIQKTKVPLIREPRIYPSEKDKSILAGMYNLGCIAGHKAYSPTPEEWAGPLLSCGKLGCICPLHLLDEKGNLID
jgi:hypothetical protein